MAPSFIVESERGPMASPDYFRKQAELCARLADAAADGELALRFKLLEVEFLFKATEANSGADQVSRAPGDRREVRDTGG
jgi:hypothetical protein